MKDENNSIATFLLGALFHAAKLSAGIAATAQASIAEAEEFIKAAEAKGLKPPQ